MRKRPEITRSWQTGMEKNVQSINQIREGMGQDHPVCSA